MKVKAGLNPNLMLTRDSITHFFGGEPASATTPSDKHKKVGDPVLELRAPLSRGRAVVTLSPAIF